MATSRRTAGNREIVYPTSDGRAFDSDLHRDLMADLIQTLRNQFAADPMVHVTGNLLLYYEEGNKWKRVAPDVFVIRGVPKRLRDYYLLWLEGKAPDIVIELTSKKTRSEDTKKKMGLYRDVLKIPEYFLFDPYEEYLKPSMQGYRLVEGNYEPIEPIDGHLPSEVLGLHLVRSGTQLRLVQVIKPGRWLLTPREIFEAERQRADQAEAENARRRQRNSG
jgi:Uma2 family endonuclease